MNIGMRSLSGTGSGSMVIWLVIAGLTTLANGQAVQVADIDVRGYSLEFSPATSGAFTVFNSSLNDQGNVILVCDPPPPYPELTAIFPDCQSTEELRPVTNGGNLYVSGYIFFDPNGIIEYGRVEWAFADTDLDQDGVLDALQNGGFDGRCFGYGRSF